MLKNIIKPHLKKLMDKNKVERKEKHLFIHIPKTAGTSFRSALEEKHKVITDYGVNEARTSLEIKECGYLSNDPYLLNEAIDNADFDWLCGHTPIGKYSDSVSVVNIVTFVREPVAQFISHYNHFVRLRDFDGDITKFMAVYQGKQNFQHKYLSYIPLGLIGCVGITEQYDESLLLINNHLGIDLERKDENINSDKALEIDGLDDDIKQLVLKSNRLDIKLYEEALFLHQTRLKLLNAGMPWVYGTVQINPKNVLSGCAYFAHSADVVELSIHKNGEPIAKINAQNYYHVLCKVNFPRARYIGFNFPLPKTATNNDSFDVYVSETGQKINYQSLKVKS
jgi:hypothetical protein